MRIRRVAVVVVSVVLQWLTGYMKEGVSVCTNVCCRQREAWQIDCIIRRYKLAIFLCLNALI